MNYRNAYNAIKGHIFSQFHISEETIKVSHTSLKKLEKEDFNSIKRYFISSLVPASALPSWGSMPQLGNKKMYCICLSRHRALTSKCRRGDASPPGEDASLAGKGTLSAGEDALSAHHIYILFRISDRSHCPSCSIQGNRYG